MGRETRSISTGAPGAPDTHDVWAAFRLMVLGELLQHPPLVRGERRTRLLALAGQGWSHPQTGERMSLGYSTIARWYDVARRASDPVAVLRRQPRAGRGTSMAITDTVGQQIQAAYSDHPEWSTQLIYDNVAASCRQQDARTGTTTALASYQTVRRYMRRLGLMRRRRLDWSGTAQAIKAEQRFIRREVDHYECTHVGALVHWDFHHGSLVLPDSAGKLYHPRLIAFLDDRSRLVLHAQWYAEETARVVVHCFAQACAKFGIPRAAYNDNGSAMRAAEIREGFDRLGVAHKFTQVYSPFQNGKLECFWNQVEGRLLAMARHVVGLDLAGLNRLTMAWLVEEYYRHPHDTTREPPLDRFAQGPTVMRPTWQWEDMIRAFTQTVTRKVRRAVGTVSVAGAHFDLPSAYRHLEKVTLRVARWDLSQAFLTDPRTDTIYATVRPSDPEARSDGHRRPRQPPTDDVPHAASVPLTTTNDAMPPLLREILERFTQRGSPMGLLTDTGLPSSTPPPSDASSSSAHQPPLPTPSTGDDLPCHHTTL